MAGDPSIELTGDTDVCPETTNFPGLPVGRVDSLDLLPARGSCLMKMLPLQIQNDGQQNREAAQFGNQTRID
jgi:hypothetical protein